MVRRPPISTRTYTLLPSTTLFRSAHPARPALSAILRGDDGDRQRPRVHEPRADALAAGGAHAAALSRRPRLYRRTRSEEHTSELQSLMRISYAVFCLKKKT